MYTKTDSKLVSPIDMILYFLCEKISGFFHKLGFTPNDITTFSFISAIIGFKSYLEKSNINLVIFWFFISYFFDCLDGTMARKYNQETEFGDYYDHITDWISACFLIYILVQTKYFKQNLIIVFGLFLITLIYIGCQERLLMFNTGKSSGSLSMTKKMCKGDKNKVIHKLNYLKFFGLGTINFIILLLIKFR